MKVLVTGANGLLGHHVVFELLKRQHDVNIIVRSTKNIHFELSKVSVYKGNFTTYADLLNASSGCEAIIHIAAVTANDLLRFEDYQKINSEGVRQVIRVSEEQNIKNVVFVSTSNTIGYGNEFSSADETHPIQYPFSKSFYARSKQEAEQLFVEASKTPGNHFVVIHPTFMIGPYDPKPSSGKLMLMGYKKRLFFVPSGGKNFVTVQDVAHVVCNAMIQGRNGGHYLASGVNLSFKEFYYQQKEVGKYPQFLIIIPNIVLIFIGMAGDIFRKLGVKTDLCSMNLRQLMVREYYTHQKAKTELNLPESDLKNAVKEALDWFKEKEMI